MWKVWLTEHSAAALCTYSQALAHDPLPICHSPVAIQHFADIGRSPFLANSIVGMLKLGTIKSFFDAGCDHFVSIAVVDYSVTFRAVDKAFDEFDTVASYGDDWVDTSLFGKLDGKRSYG